MKIYLVGGAVRDQLLHQPIKERDWVVVGATPEMLLAKGYKQVGKDFPVFLHPATKEEYALARQERKIAKGYTGFCFDTSPEVSLEQDLLRRDLTINAIAQAADGQLIDPYHGQADIDRQQLRHVSPAFIEDPVRILRIARFAARLPTFSIAPETQQLMQQMVQSGEVNALVPERVWRECEQAMAAIAPWRFIDVLFACGALAILFPPLASNYEISLKLLQASIAKFDQAIDRFILLLQSVASIAEIEKLCHAYKMPKQLARMASLVMKYRTKYTSVMDDGADEILQTLQSLDAFRRPARFHQWLRLCELTTQVLDDSTEASAKAYSYCYQQSLLQLNDTKLTSDELQDLHQHEIGSFLTNKRLSVLHQALPAIKKTLH